VVFSDLSGSTTLGEPLDPESLSQVMAIYYEAGEDLVDTELVVALTEALAAAHDPFYGSGR
jgi:hypothetical protein